MPRSPSSGAEAAIFKAAAGCRGSAIMVGFRFGLILAVKCSPSRRYRLTLPLQFSHCDINTLVKKSTGCQKAQFILTQKVYI